MRIRHAACLACLALAALLGLTSTTSADLLINEIDSDSVNQPTTDAFEFVELFETSGSSIVLDDYVLVYFNGNGNVVYRAMDLDGLRTNAQGYFTAGSIVGADLAVPGNTLQNGVDAVALYRGTAIDFPNGTAPTKTNLVDAVVYKTGADVDGVGLDTALLDRGPIVDEFSRDGTAATAPSTPSAASPTAPASPATRPAGPS